MKIAVEGCAHGELERIYDTLLELEKQEGIKIDLLLCCGDFQATRNEYDLSCMAVSHKYRQMCSFYKYYSGEKEAPILTIFIGGNHEASNHLQELSYGGWAAPNIYYLGYASVVTIGGVRIAGLSGIYKGRDYMRGHFERAPYSEDTKRSVYHIRNLEVFRLKQLSQPIDIIMSHDWPRGITDYGDKERLLKRKPFFRKDIEDNVLGSKPAEDLLHELKPKYWFAAHLHCKFPAIVEHGPRKGMTKFLALDKCLPRRKFLQVLDVEHDTSKPLSLSYDLEWLTIVHLTNHLVNVKKGITYMPGKSDLERWIFTPTEDEKDHVLKRFGGDLTIPLNFTKTVTPYNPDSGTNNKQQSQGVSAHLNPQTVLLCEKLGVDDPLALLLDSSQDNTPSSLSLSVSSLLTPERPSDASQVSFTPGDSSQLDSSLEDLSGSVISSSGSRSTFAPMKRLSLSLPQPKQLVLADDSADDFVPLSSSQDSSETTTAASEENSSTVETKVEDSTKDSVEEQPEVSVPTKKFKRRNQALYTNTDDD